MDVIKKLLRSSPFALLNFAYLQVIQRRCFVLGVQPLLYPSTLAPLKWLEGTWRCEDHGQGEFPTIKPFRYSEEVIWLINFERMRPKANLD